MFTGVGSLSLKRSSAAAGTNSSIAYQNTVFATKASAGDTGINLQALVTPPEMSANGFVNPSSTILASANLLFNRKNLILWSSRFGRMADFYQYTVSTSGFITFVGFTAEEGEIFTGTILAVPTNGLQVVDTLQPPATGTLTKGTTDFVVGFPFVVNQNPTTNIGSVLVYKNGQLLERNTGNVSAASILLSGKGDYQEVDVGTGLGQLIRFNVVDADNDAEIVVIPNGRLALAPTGSIMAVVESLQGQVNTLATYVATLAGTTTLAVTGANPSNVDLQAFGNRVLALETNRARIDQANTFVGTQTFSNALIASSSVSVSGGLTVTGGPAVSNATQFNDSTALPLTVSANNQGSNRLLIMASISYRFTNNNGTGLTTKVTATVKDGTTTIETIQATAVCASGYNDVMTFSFSRIYPAASSGTYSITWTDTESDGGSHTISNVRLSASASTVQLG